MTVHNQQVDVPDGWTGDGRGAARWGRERCVSPPLSTGRKSWDCPGVPAIAPVDSRPSGCAATQPAAVGHAAAAAPHPQHRAVSAVSFQP
jgi:hypothetical protein